MQFDNLLVEIKNGIAWVTVNRPKALNALNKATITELGQCFETLLNDASVKGVILRGGGEKAFVAGADITEFKGLSPDQGSELSREGQVVFDAIASFPKPVMAAIQGFALGGGCELALACHLRVASEKARFGQPEVNLGLIPGFGGTQRLFECIGKTHAMEWLLSGEMYAADHAYSVGLLNRVVPHEQLDEAAESLMKIIISRAPMALAHIVRTTGAYFNTEEEGYLVERQLFGLLCESKDFEEGVAAFLEKRPAIFRGE
jgi:enoyl-CoA hydratase